MRRILSTPLPIGHFFLAAALLANEWTIVHLVSSDGSFELPNLVLIRVADVLLLLIGLTLLFFKVRASLGLLLFNAFLLGVLLLAVEFGLMYIMRTPPQSAALPVIGPLKRELYNGSKELIQYRPECAQHDERLGYTLRPGTCMFVGAEFSNEYRINSLGLRDDEESLGAPEIIVLGDSYAMGWGVKQEETFAERLAIRTGKKVLNAAISSYGTARQMLNLERLDTSRLETLVVQYCGNDYDENAAFLRRDHKLATMSAKKYARVVDAHQRGRGYFLGKHLLMLCKTRAGQFHRVLVESVAKIFDVPRQASPTAADEADCFARILAGSKQDLSGVRIVALELGPIGTLRQEFATALADGDDARPEMQVIDLTQLLGAEHFYPLDGHINAHGHQAVAEAIVATLER